MIASFGLFLVLAFAGAFLAFGSEYRRRGINFAVAVWPWVVRVMVGGVAGVTAAKLTYRFRHWAEFVGSPADFLVSVQGDWWVGLAVAVLVVVLYRPGWRRLGLMDGLLLCCGVAGLFGALLFAMFEDPGHIGLHGFNFYGALIAGTAAFLYINRRHGIGLLTALDIGSPGMMLAYAVGRLGCHFSGDGDWGIANFRVRPAWLGWLPDWAWAWRYPHNSVRQGEYIPGCSGGYCTRLVHGVWPTPLYEAVVCLGLFGVLWAVRRRIVRPGLLFALYAVMNGCERFLVEMIRVTPRYEVWGLRVSQAQVIAVGLVVIGTFLFLRVKWIALFFVLLPVNGRSQSGVRRDTMISRFFQRDTGWIASDGCISIPLSDRRVLWMMGDSYIDNYNKARGTVGCLFQVRNSALLQPLGDWRPSATSTLVGSGPSGFLRNDPRDSHLLWPTGGWQVGDTVYVYANNIVNASGGLGFASGGSDFLARLRMPDLTPVGYDSLPWFNGAVFGLGFDNEEKGDYVYTWGSGAGISRAGSWWRGCCGLVRGHPGVSGTAAAGIRLLLIWRISARARRMGRMWQRWEPGMCSSARSSAWPATRERGSFCR
ncbi:prolipoprotein diacylglyceryl transferase family protein [Puia sp. P3]|uniref:prolipoprotein diacylglyceryl transferase n=1 Tax=Puia sp. P3 TaxID=3423952 RepID=UPI003D67102C